ncbi:hypothetical protein [Sporofaciens sp. SGI.106]|uniref:hypothetical protein n=1 Tax=Sporofaciens sp. SGI.106 TaxID=3420568 RepID=UPI003D064E0C
MREDEKLNNAEQQLEEIKVLKKSLYEKKEKVDDFWNTFLRTGAIILATLIVLVFLGIAWFVMNNWVKGESAAISALGENRFSLATLIDEPATKQGVYDVSVNDESALAKALNKFWRADRNGRDDDKGNHYTSFLNLPNLVKGTSTFIDKDGNTYILGDSDGISLQVNSESNVNNTEEFEHIGPGSRGKVTFYIIPHIDNFDKVKLSVSLKAFTLVREGEPNDKTATGRAVPVEKTGNQVLMNMLQGHILLFAGADEKTGNYSNRILPKLEDDGRISFVFEKDRTNTAWEKDQPVPITVYWIWPRRFENIKYCGQEDSVFKSECDSHTELLRWMDEKKECVVNTNEIDTTSLVAPWENMTNKEFAQWSTGYNKGDQLIGENVAYFQWMIEAE